MGKSGNMGINMQRTGRWLRNLCGWRGVSAKDICGPLGISCPQSVYAWFNGRTLPSMDNLYALSRVLKVPLGELLMAEGESLPREFQENRSPRQVRLVWYSLEMEMIRATQEAVRQR